MSANFFAIVRVRGVSHSKASIGNIRDRWTNRQPNNRVPRSIHGTNTDDTGITSAQHMFDISVTGCSFSTEKVISPHCVTVMVLRLN